MPSCRRPQLLGQELGLLLASDQELLLPQLLLAAVQLLPLHEQLVLRTHRLVGWLCDNCGCCFVRLALRRLLLQLLLLTQLLLLL